MIIFFLNRKSPESKEITKIDKIFIQDTDFSSFSDLVIDESIHVKTIDVVFNKIKSLIDAPNFVQHTSELLMQENPLETISPSFFTKLVNLDTLTIEVKETAMKENIFEPLKNLTKLLLVTDDLKPEWFTGLVNLEELHIMSSKLTSFDDIGLLNALPNMKLLELDARSLDCTFGKKLVEDLKNLNRFGIIKKRFKEFDNPSEGFYLFRSVCKTPSV